MFVVLVSSRDASLLPSSVLHGQVARIYQITSVSLGSCLLTFQYAVWICTLFILLLTFLLVYNFKQHAFM